MLDLLGFASGLPGGRTVGLILEHVAVLLAIVSVFAPALYWTIFRKERDAGRTRRRDFAEGIALSFLCEAYAAGVFTICRFMVANPLPTLLRAGTVFAVAVVLTAFIRKTFKRIREESSDA